MPNEVPKSVFLAGSTVEVISALASLSGLGIHDAAVLVERNISFKTAALDPLLAAARARFPTIRFIELALQRPPPESVARKTSWNSFGKRWAVVRSLRQQLDAVCRASIGVSLMELGRRVDTVYFDGLHDYVLVFLDACRGKPRVIFPHGFDQPSRLILQRDPYLHRHRRVRTVLETFAAQKDFFGFGGLALGVLGRLLPGTTTVCLPFTGVNRVVTFRSGIDPVANEVVRVESLADTFRWLLQVPPWSDLLRERGERTRGGSLLLLLSEYNCHSVWEKNRNYGLAHWQLIQRVSRVTGLKRLVIKAHIRSDGSAAAWLAGFLKERERDWEVEVLPLALSGLPVEALALTGEFAAACSLGSCSLPPGLGFGMPHYVSLNAAGIFDEGWQDPFWIKYVAVGRSLIDEGICRDIDPDSKDGARA